MHTVRSCQITLLEKLCASVFLALPLRQRVAFLLRLSHLLNKTRFTTRLFAVGSFCACSSLEACGCMREQLGASTHTAVGSFCQRASITDLSAVSLSAPTTLVLPGCAVLSPLISRA